MDEIYQTCEIHGPYTSKVFLGIRSKCPQCAEEWHRRKQAEMDEYEHQNKLLRIAKAIDNACIPVRFKDSTLETYVCETDRMRAALKKCQDYIDRFGADDTKGDPLAMVGSYGTGKTHLAIGVMKRLIEQEKVSGGMYTTLIDMLLDIRATYDTPGVSERDVINKYRRIPLLVIDEIGVQKNSDAEKITIFNIMNSRYNDYKATILISNLPYVDVKPYIGERVADRLKTKGGLIAAFDWASWRGR